MRNAMLLVAAMLSAGLLAAQDFEDLKVERFSSGYRFTEGPVWSVKEGALYFSDVPNNRIHKVIPGQKVEVFRESSGAANGNAFDTKGNLYTCEGGAQRVTRTPPKGAVEVVADKFEGKPFTAPNDIVVRPDGNFYFTDPAFGSQEERKQLPFFGIYHVGPKGEIEAVAKWTTRPNGIVLSPNGRTLYVANSDERQVRAFDVDRSGKATNERVLISGIDGVPDGIKVDEKGNIYVTCRGVAIYTPQGKLIKMLEIPEIPANCAFGDPDLMSLYVTARTSVYRVRMPIKGWVPER